MAGIDNNTVLMLHGEEIVDSSVAPKNITNNGVTVNNNGKFDKGLNLSSNQYLKVASGMQGVDLAGDFTIEWWEYSTGESLSSAGLFVNRIVLENEYGRGILLGHSGTKLYTGKTETRVWDGFNGVTIKDKTNNVWVHWRLVKKGTLWTSYKNGVKFWSATNSTSPSNFNYDCAIGCWIDHTNFNSGYNAIIDEFRICNYAVCDGDFTPPTQPYNSIIINKTNQTDTNIEFSIEKLGQETINKVEVLINNSLSETYTDNYDSIDYVIDTELCDIGENNITIRVTYDDVYTEELLLSYFYKPNSLPLETPLLDTVERVKLLTKLKQAEKNMLSNILTSKNVEVAEEDKMSDLIGKVDLLGEYDDDKLWLYKDGDEYTDVTGGFVSHQVQSKPPTLTKTSSYMEYKAQSGSYTSGHYGTNLPINVTDYSLLKFEVETLNMGSTQYGCNFGLTTNKDMNSSVAAIQITTNKSKHIISLDISSIRGLNYVYSDTTYNNTSRIYKIWLEK